MTVVEFPKGKGAGGNRTRGAGEGTGAIKRGFFAGVGKPII